MKEVAKLQIKDRTELFQATAISMGMQPNVIEKDFWVCFMLDHLFHDCRYKNAFVFKGGTSLSKSYHVIERFSEDIDLILDWRKIINDEVNPWEERSKTKQDLFNKQINSEAAKFYKEELIPRLNSEMKEKLGDGLDRRLAEKITVSDIGYLDVNCDFQKYNDILEKIKDYINGIQMFMNQVPFYGDYMIELTDVCKCVIKTYNALMEGNYQNSELIFSYLDLLYDHANLLYANRDFKIQECINKTEEHHRQPIDEEKIKEQFEEFHQLMNQILHKHAVFDFRFENMENYENL